MGFCWRIVGSVTLPHYGRVLRHSDKITRNSHKNLASMRSRSKRRFGAYLPLGSFVPKGDHGIDAHRAVRGNVAGEESDSDKHNRDGCKCEWVASANAVEQAGHQTR